MFSLFGLLNFPLIWLAVPLALAFSLTYAATRAEEPREILTRAGKHAFWLAFFMILIALALRIAV